MLSVGWLNVGSGAIFANVTPVFNLLNVKLRNGFLIACERKLVIMKPRPRINALNLNAPAATIRITRS
jgi:hypothetical protein